VKRVRTRPQPPQRDPTAFETILTRPPIFELIFADLSPGSLIRLGRTCRLAQQALTIFYSGAFNINRHLSRFFSNPVGFRSLQARTATLISGSSALQFLDRTFYPESDLDLYAHPDCAREVGLWLIQNEGYIFTPNLSQETEEFADLPWRPLWTPWLLTSPREDITTEDLHVDHYRIPGLQEIFSFRKPQPNGDDLKLQIMVAKNTPLQCILAFHSSTRSVAFISQSFL
jgi:hypothetical protein